MSSGFALTALTGLALLLAAAVAYEVTSDVGAESGGDAAAAASPAQVAAASPATAAATAKPNDLAADVLARPLFALTRKPPTGAAAPATAASGPVTVDVPRLSGIVIMTDTKIAVFQPKDASKPIVVNEGGEVAGRKVETIEGDEVVLRGPDGEEERLHPIPDPALAAAAGAMSSEVDPPPPRRPRPGVAPRPVVNRPGMPRQPGVVPGRPNIINMPNPPVRGRRPPGLPGGPPTPRQPNGMD